MVFNILAIPTLTQDTFMDLKNLKNKKFCSCFYQSTFRNHGFLAAVFYALCSTSMAFLNKAVISSYDFNFPFFIMACQMTLSVVFLELMRLSGRIKIPPYTWKAAQGFLLPSFSYGLHATLSLIALRGMNIPMYTAVKRCTPLVNLIFAVVILRKPFPSFALIASIFFITVGCVIAAYGDLTFDPYAYTIGGFSVFAQGLYLTLVQRASESCMSTFEILQLNNLNFQVIFWLLVTLGAILNYSLFLCTSLNSALTTSLVGVAKSSVQTLLGFFTFGGVSYQPWNVAGISLNFFGGLIYTYSKYKESKRILPKHHSDDEKLLELKVNNNYIPKSTKDFI
ncbi:Solute carrier family 35 member D3 [Armadillidium nasatum]|uniref:Solute carrier family 35 member D3 n=1 Tax=Armadillidium nasatum TaxID=96803 RepID=A0A5N5TJQ4_9CRUS|nr:Solute carrier family 35 member D3 [Armadillidium nasatum]